MCVARWPDAGRSCDKVEIVLVALVNYFHAGDVILSRALIRRVRPLLIDRVALELRCMARYAYLWEDLGLPIYGVQDAQHEPDVNVNVIDMWFGSSEDLLGVSGLTHATQVTSYNRRAAALGLPILDPSEPVPPIDFPERTVRDEAGVLVENGPVLSGQNTAELTPMLARLAEDFPRVPFYCTSKPPSGPSNLIDISSRNLVEISALSNSCRVMIARLSGPFVATLTHGNRGRLRRLVLGYPIGCPIWDETDVEYHTDWHYLQKRLKEILS